MTGYYYRCSECGRKYGKDEIEKNFLYLCPACASVEKNSPLHGILFVEYDYDAIKMNYDREELLRLQPGKFWQYEFLWPVDFGIIFKSIKNQQLNKLALPNNLLFEFSYEGKAFSALDDTRNPTLSFKDRASALVCLKAIELGIKEIAAASTGNAGSSLAGCSSRLGLKAHIFVPRNIPEAKRIQIQTYGAAIYIVDGDYDLAFDTCLEVTSAHKIYNRNTAYNPLTIEGKKSAAYDIFIASRGQIPDLIFVPSGDGVILTGLHKGFTELKELGWIERIPQLIAVQAEGSNAIARYFNRKQFDFIPAASVADSICAGAPRALYTAARAIEDSQGSAIEVSDAEILEAQKILACSYGILLEPASAAAFAGYKKFLSSGKLEDRSALLLFTGNGLKDISALKLWNEKPGTLSACDIKIIGPR